MEENTGHTKGDEANHHAPGIFTSLVESKLIEGCQRGDRGSQKAFYTRYSPLVLGMCYRYSAGEKDALPMCVFVFKELFREMKHLPKDQELMKWAASRVIWNAIRYLHQDKHTFFIAKTTRYEENKPVYEEINESALTTEARRDIYLSALQALTPSYRILYNLTYIDELPSKEILAGLQMAEETYRAELEQARFQFKKQLNVSNHEYRRGR